MEKKLIRVVDGVRYARFPIPIRTHVVTKSDNIVDFCKTYAAFVVEPTDMIFVSEKIVAISQGRSFHIDSILPRPMATYLSNFVQRSKHGVGLGSPYTMELAIREVGIIRIVVAAALAALTKPFRVRGVFYRVAGNHVNAIDGPCNFTIPPYNEYAKLPPANPDRVAREIGTALNVNVVIIDANDLGVNVLGRSSKSISVHLCKELFRDNPLGQGREQTPLCVVRRVE